MKKCLKCLENKDLLFFGKDNKKTDGLKSYCKECRKLENSKNKEYREKNKENLRIKRQEKYKNPRNRKKILERTLKWQRKRDYGGNYENIFSLYKNKCAICGSRKMLVIHHIDKSGLTSTKNISLVNNKIDNLILLCKIHHSFVHHRINFDIKKYERSGKAN